MKLKQLFCRHKKLTAVGIYEEQLTPSIADVIIVLKCNKCNEEIKIDSGNLFFVKQKHRLIDFSQIIEHELWGKWW